MSIGEMGENFEGGGFGFDFSWVIWGGEVWCCGGIGICMVGRNGLGVGFLG